MIVQSSPQLTLTWQEDNKEVGVSAPLEVWVAQMILILPQGSQGLIMDAVIAEVERLNDLPEEEETEDEEVEDENENSA